MAKVIVERLLKKIIPALALLTLLFAALYFAAQTRSDIRGAGDFYMIAFAATGIALLVLTGAIIHRIIRLGRQLRSGVAGSRMTLRMVILFVALAVPPATIVYGFSIDFVSRTIDSWFDVDVETALDDAMFITQSFLELQERMAGNQISRLARRLEDVRDDRLVSVLTEMASETGALEVTVLGRSGRQIKTARRFLSATESSAPDELSLVQARQLGLYVDEEPDGEGGLIIRALAPIERETIGQEERILQAIFPVTAGFDRRAANVERQLQHYARLAYQRTFLRDTFALVLSLVLLLSVLLAVLLAFNTAKKLVMPIGKLADATQAVAGGDYEKRIEAVGDDELAFLVRSFNAMTDEVGKSSHAAESSRLEAEQRRDFLEAVLGRVSSAVLSLDAEGRLMTHNAAADAVLGVTLQNLENQHFCDIAKVRPELAQLADAVVSRYGEAEWREEVFLEHADRQRVFVCRGAQLTAGLNVGQVVVIDDVTDLVHAQRHAAWGEVARRLAHEVKNPLTPIQLAAERIRHKYLARVDAEDRDLLDRSTRTIVAQVEALKTMVNAFSDYARAPTLQLEPRHLHQLCEEVLDLYRQYDRVTCVTDWMENEPRVLVDANRIRQLLHNLIKNAMEAEDGDLKLDMATHLDWRHGRPQLTLSLRDNGPGIARDVMDKVFEPYATTKTKGTGIGLAIVKKIVEEHGGTIRARNAASGGALFKLTFPVDPVELEQSSPARTA